MKALKFFIRWRQCFLIIVAVLSIWVAAAAVSAAFLSRGRVPEDTRHFARELVPVSEQNLDHQSAALVIDAFTVRH